MGVWADGGVPILILMCSQLFTTGLPLHIHQRLQQRIANLWNMTWLVAPTNKNNNDFYMAMFVYQNGNHQPMQQTKHSPHDIQAPNPSKSLATCEASYLAKLV